jgi:hypothetical protein
MKIEFFFRKAVIQVWIVYMPPTDKGVNREIQRTIMREICNNKINTYICIAGDFNTLNNVDLDTNNKKRKSQRPGKPLFEWLKNRDQIDTFQYLNPHKKEFTWYKDGLASRIDYIWVGEEIQALIIDAGIEDVNMITNSDHNLIWSKFKTSEILSYGNFRKKAGKRPIRKVFLYHKATESNWESYKVDVENMLKSKKSIFTDKNSNSKADINIKWDNISSSIMKAAFKNIP